MGSRGERVRSAVSEHRVKRHVFEPSKRTVWTVVGMEREYWVYPERGFCSCPGHYFGAAAGGGGGCYHLEALGSARDAGQAETVRFDDSEYVDFVAGLVSDM